MPNVRSIAAYRSRDTIAVLENMLARAKRGELEALAFCVKPAGRPEELGFTGSYQRDAELRLRVLLRISQRITRLMDEMDSQAAL